MYNAQETRERIKQLCKLKKVSMETVITNCRFVELCEKKNISKQKACTDCGLSRTAWNKWKAGAIPNGEALQILADYFDVTVDYLLTGVETKKWLAKETTQLVMTILNLLYLVVVLRLQML